MDILLYFAVFTLGIIIPTIMYRGLIGELKNTIETLKEDLESNRQIEKALQNELIKQLEEDGQA